MSILKLAFRFRMGDLLEIQLLIDSCLAQAQLAHQLAPDLPLSELLDRTAAAIGCLAPRLPDRVLQFAIDRMAERLELLPV